MRVLHADILLSGGIYSAVAFWPAAAAAERQHPRWPFAARRRTTWQEKETWRQSLGVEWHFHIFRVDDAQRKYTQTTNLRFPAFFLIFVAGFSFLASAIASELCGKSGSRRNCSPLPKNILRGISWNVRAYPSFGTNCLPPLFRHRWPWNGACEVKFPHVLCPFVPEPVDIGILETFVFSVWGLFVALCFASSWTHISILEAAIYIGVFPNEVSPFAATNFEK